MKILIISVLSLLFTQGFILINEEILISICFIIIIYNSSKYFNILTNSFFVERSINIKKKIINSFIQLKQALNKIINSINLQQLIKNIKKIKKYCLKLTQKFMKWFLIDILNKIKTFYPKYIQSIKIIELKTVKLIIFFLLNNLTYALTIMNFFKSNFIIQKILGYSLLNLRESIFQFKKFYK